MKIINGHCVLTKSALESNGFEFTAHSVGRLVRLPAFRSLALAVGLTVLGSTSANAAPTLVVDDNLVECPAAAYTTIAAAVAAAASGDTIQVCAGTYAENVILNKSLTLLGAQAGVDARGRVASESILAPVSGTGLSLQTGAAGTIVDGLTFQGGSVGLDSSSGPIDNLQILNNQFVGFTGNGIFLNDSGTDITVDQNVVDGSSKTGGGGLVHLDTDGFAGFWLTNNEIVNGATGTGFFVDGNHNVGESATRAPKISGNLFSGNGTGANLGSRAFGTLLAPALGTYGGVIESNTFSDNNFDGLQGGMQHVLITSNTFENNGRSGIALTSFGSIDLTRGAQNSTIECNLFVDNITEGIFLSSSQPAATMATNLVIDNSIVGNSVGLTHTGAATIDASSNWWGDASGPTIASNPTGTGDPIANVSGSVTYTPFLTSQSACAPQLPVVPVSAVKQAVLDELTALYATLTDKEDKSRLNDAIKHLTKSLSPDKWLDGSHPKPGKMGESVFNEEKAAVVKLKELRNSNDSGLSTAQMQGYIDVLAAADRSLATIAIDEAIARGGNADKITKAQNALLKGDTEAGKDHPDKAIDQYKNAWKNAVAA